MKTYLSNCFTLLSQATNTIFLKGDPDMTICATAYINKDNSKFWSLVYSFWNKVFYKHVDHCKASFTKDITRAKKVLELAKKEGL